MVISGRSSIRFPRSTFHPDSDWTKTWLPCEILVSDWLTFKKYSPLGTMNCYFVWMVYGRSCTKFPYLFADRTINMDTAEVKSVVKIYRYVYYWRLVALTYRLSHPLFYVVKCISDESHSRNASCALNKISTLVLLSLGRYHCWWTITLVPIVGVIRPIVSISALLTWFNIFIIEIYSS